MGVVFRGWKRKAGLVTLILTCLLAAGWVRSMGRLDTIFIRGRFVVISTEARIGITDDIRLPVTTASMKAGELARIDSRPFDHELIHATSSDTSRLALHSSVKTFPYWPIVIPLTLLSVWLLLSKRHDPSSGELGA